jgi:hypothetical protein
MAFLSVILGFSVSGHRSLATASDAGADMTEAVSKWVDDTCSFRGRQTGLAFFSLVPREMVQKPHRKEMGQELNLCQRAMFPWRFGRSAFLSELSWHHLRAKG